MTDSWPYRLEVGVLPMGAADRALTVEYLHSAACIPLGPPACWEWAELARERAEQDLDLLPRPHDLPSLLAWHAGRCANCGARPARLVCDHDHWSGYVRGYLCNGCNKREPERYLKRHPALLFGLLIPYTKASAAAAARAAL